jgi:hypothetical protein
MGIRPLAVAAAALFTIVGGFAASAGQSLNSPALIRVTAKTAVDNDYGSTTVQAAWITDKRGRRIGSAITYCDFLGTGGPLGSGTSFCRAAYLFPRGKIMATGTRKTRASYVLTVVGGTGFYAGVGGVLLGETVELDPRVERLLFSLEP